MAEATTNGSAEINAGASVIVSVSPRQPDGAQRATVVESTESAVRLVEALIEAGCDSARVSAFAGHEVRVGIEYNPTVALYDGDGGIIAAAFADAATSQLTAPA